MSKYFIFFAVLGAVLVIVGLANFFNPASLSSTIDGFNNEKQYPLSIEGTHIAVTVADTPAKRAAGLSSREFLPDNEGLLFIFGEPGKHLFWMKDMHFPIDVVWINERFMVVDVTENILPATFPEIFEPMEPVRFVLEVNAGWIAKNGIKRGMWIENLELLSY